MDASKQMDLLEEELQFNEGRFEMLRRLQLISNSLDAIQKELLDDSPLQAASSLDAFSSNLPLSSTFGNSLITAVIENTYIEYQEIVTERLSRTWNEHIQTDTSAKTIRIRGDTDSGSRELLNKAKNAQDSVPHASELIAIVDALYRLGTLEAILIPFCTDVERLIIAPRLCIQDQGTAASVLISDDSLSSGGQSSDLSAHLLFSDLKNILAFLQEHLPRTAFTFTIGRLMPPLISRLISIWLMSSVPESVEGLQPFHETIALVRDFAITIEKDYPSGAKELERWIEQIPNAWLAKHRNASLDQVRGLMSKGFGDAEIVERVETQTIDQTDDIHTANGNTTEWDSNWSDEGEGDSTQMAEPRKAGSNPADDEFDAWGLEDDKANEEKPESQKGTAQVEDDGDAWGWNEEEDADEEQESKAERSSEKPAEPQPKSNQTSAPLRQTITLTEKYHITQLPKGILAIIQSSLADAAALQRSSGVSFLAPTGNGLLSLPGLVLSMFRASASGAYTVHTNGNMFLYNDSLWLAEQMETLAAPASAAGGGFTGSPDGLHTLKILDGQIQSLKSYGKRSYAREMESQRTILTDILDGAQGFVHCTQHPFNQECDIAIASTVERLRMLRNEWSSVLSKTALLQSLGSLMSTATSKIIMDIEDMSDISEPESQQLTRYCGRIASLEDLFLPDGVERNEDAVPVTAFYVPNWFKFQYLVNILESSLVDIKFMWTESELSLEFQTEELIDLILALFADSPHRRTAIAEVRSARR